MWNFKEDGIAECDIKDFSKNIVLYCVFFLVKTIIGYLGIKKQKTKHEVFFSSDDNNNTVNNSLLVIRYETLHQNFP